MEPVTRNQKVSEASSCGPGRSNIAVVQVMGEGMLFNLVRDPCARRRDQHALQVLKAWAACGVVGDLDGSDVVGVHPHERARSTRRHRGDLVGEGLASPGDYTTAAP